MRPLFFPRLAWQGMTKNRRLCLPWLLSCVGMVFMSYIFEATASSPLLLGMKGGGSVAMVLILGKWVMAFFALLFLSYTHSFLLRRRNREFGLYHVLGMDKGAIVRVVAWETLITAAIALAVGLSLGVAFSKLVELGLVNMLRAQVDYLFRFSPSALLTTVEVFAAIFLLLLLGSVIQLWRRNTLELLQSCSVRFPHDGARSVVKTIEEAVNFLLQQQNIPRGQLESVGIVVPGSIDQTGERVIDAYNLGFHDVPLKALVQEAFEGVPVYLANDANGAALAELYAGAFRGCRTAVLLTLGTGLGGGIIFGGHMFNGGMNQGVELGHMYLVNGGEHCTCGNDGCMEAYCAASALARDGKRAMLEHPESLIAARAGGAADAVDAKLVIDCAKEGDETAKEVFDRYIDSLSSACASIYNLLDPEVIAIGGGVCGAGEFLFAPLRERTTGKCFYKTHGKLIPAELGNDAGMIGAAMLHRDAQ